MIKHDGIVVAVYEDGTALVRIVQTSACAACKAKAMCASAESAEKEMRVTLLMDNGRPAGYGTAVNGIFLQKNSFCLHMCIFCSNFANYLCKIC